MTTHRDILDGVRSIAVVGLSDKPARASNGVARFLVDRGYRCTGVNPALAGRSVSGIPVVATLAALPELDAMGFLKAARAQAKALSMPEDLLKRNVNVGFSGGEKKRNEVLQMAMLAPSFAILDETDSGLDIDALRIVAEGVNALRSPDFSALVITHHQRLLDYLVPDRVHVMARGRILRSGGPELAHQLEAQGYAGFLAEAA